MYEVQRHVTVRNRGYLGSAVIANKNWSDCRNFSTEEETTKRSDERALLNTTQVHELTAAERDAWRKALLPVHKEMESRFS
ncbi:MAG: hypothetical protein HY308_18900 [Gammaproteobacteria bacterium]|nr:hypothetical protein [Gammaproteobacteria bacterium]